MSYPNVTAAEVRNGISHITTALRSDARISEIIIEATDWAESRMHSKIDLDALVALATTPPLWKTVIIYRSRALVLAEAYGTSRIPNPEDVKNWNDLAEQIISGLTSGSTKLLDSTRTLIETGMNYAGIESNKDAEDGDHGPYFGHGPDGEYKTNINDNSVYNEQDEN